MALIVADGNADFIFGLAGNSVLSRKAEGLMKNVRGHLDLHRSLAAHDLESAMTAVRLFGEFEHAAKNWPHAFRVVLKAVRTIPADDASTATGVVREYGTLLG